MNIFYAPPEQIFENSLELREQEANHVSKILRYKQGDEITVVDGKGGWYEGKINRITPQKVMVEITSRKKNERDLSSLTVAIGLIKKRDRLEFAVEKAVELGAAEIAVFRAEHSVKQNVRKDRLEAQALSAMKQSLRAYLPSIKIFNLLEELIKNYTDYLILVAHQSGDILQETENTSYSDNFLLITGPEGDFSNEELQSLRDENAQFISLGKHRLRTETAAIVFLNSFMNLYR